MATAREVADQVRALSRIATSIRSGSRQCNLDASWLEAAAQTLSELAIAKREAERHGRA